MPTLPLYTPPNFADAWHDVRAPGGYEWWYFDAEDPATDTRVVAILLDGFCFHPKYLRDHAKYLRWPTRFAPPTPRDFPCAYAAVYRGGEVLAQFMSQYPAGALRADSGARAPGFAVELGPNFVRFEAGRYHINFRGSPWALTWQGPRRTVGGTLTLDLSFAPRIAHPPHERTFLSRRMTGAEHRWVVAAPLCAVAGEVRLKPSGEEAEQVFSFSGGGYHDHNYGTAPLGPGLKRWTWGRVLQAGRATVFHVAEPTGGNPETHLLVADREGVREIQVKSLEVTGARRSRVGLACPARIRCDELLSLSNPRLIDVSPFYLRAVYDARTPVGIGTAFCETAFPHRLRWPLLGRMIEMSIDKCS